MLPEINQESLLDFLVNLLNTPRPTGFSDQAVRFVQKAFEPISVVKTSLTRKGALIVRWDGVRNDHPRALTAHVDTLGVMVKEILSGGRLKMTQIGGYSWNSIEGEGCRVFTRSGRVLRGSILINKASVHVFGAEVSETKRNGDNMEIRLDECTASAEETSRLGVNVGDFVALDPRVEVNNLFVRSRHLDDKAGAACLYSAIQSLAAAGLKPVQTTYFMFTTFEEVGHGASAGLPEEVEEVVVVDMAAVGTGQASDEFHSTLCVKDSTGPYHAALGRKMTDLADEFGIPYKVDIYPSYGSDGSALWRAGSDAAVALIGPGVDASHNYERTHVDALLATTRWIMAYLLD
jgi:putative aminopeptidase FrvX